MILLQRTLVLRSIPVGRPMLEGVLEESIDHHRHQRCSYPVALSTGLRCITIKEEESNECGIRFQPQ